MRCIKSKFCQMIMLVYVVIHACKIVLAPLKRSLSAKTSLEKSNIVSESMFVTTLEESGVA